MNRQRLYENIMKDLRRAFRRSLNEDILDDIDIDDPEEEDIATKMHKQIRSEIIYELLVEQHKELPVDFLDINKDVATWKPENSEKLKDIIEGAVEVYGNEVNLNWIDISEIADMSEMFDNSQFNGDISKWDVSNVTNMSYMFHNSDFNGNISKWDVSNVTDMCGMFLGSLFNGDISNWDVSNVTDMFGMFWQSEFNGDISQWDVSNVTNMGGMFLDSPLEKNPPKWYKNK